LLEIVRNELRYWKNERQSSVAGRILCEESLESWGSHPAFPSSVKTHTKEELAGTPERMAKAGPTGGRRRVKQP